jgi:hypothetical protein
VLQEAKLKYQKGNYSEKLYELKSESKAEKSLFMKKYKARGKQKKNC